MTTSTILVVEDSDEDFDTVAEAFAASPTAYALDRATTGEACLARMRAARVGFVLLDLNLPGMDGRTTLAEIRADASLRDVPVIVLSTSANPRDIDACYRGGVNAYHVKPMRYRDHLTLIRELLAYWCAIAWLPRGQEVGR